MVRHRTRRPGRPPGILYPKYLALAREAVGPGAPARVFGAGFYRGAASVIEILGTAGACRESRECFRELTREILALQRVYERVTAALLGEPESGPAPEGMTGDLCGRLLEFRGEMDSAGRDGDDQLTADSGFVAGASMAMRALQDSLSRGDPIRTFRAIDRESAAMIEQFARTGLPRINDGD